jgi:hypothetical protein
VSVVAHTVSNGGSLLVYVDGRYVRSVSLYSARTHYDAALLLVTFSRPATHTVKLVLGAARPRGSVGTIARIDGLAVG